MKKDIQGERYDTETAVPIASHEHDTTHVRRVDTLYRTDTGAYFLLEEQEAHGVPSATIVPLDAVAARAWLVGHGKGAIAEAMMP